MTRSGCVAFACGVLAVLLAGGMTIPAGAAEPDSTVAPLPAPASDTTATPPAPAVRAPGTPGVRDTVTALPSVNVSGTRSSGTRRQAATTVNLKRSDLTKFQPSSTADALLAAPGIDLNKAGPWASRISVRGLSGDRVVVLVDGVRLNSVRGHGAQPSLISIDRLDAVELLPGANSTFYGSDALGGVVNLITHRPLFADQTLVGLTVASRGVDPGGTGSLSARARLQSRDFGAEVFGTLGRREALVTPDGEVPNSGDRERDLTARVTGRWRGAVLDYEHAHHAALDVGLPVFNAPSGSSAMFPLQGRDADRLELTLPGTQARPHVNVLGVLQTFRTQFTETNMDSIYFRRNLSGFRNNVAADDVTTRARGVTGSLQSAGLGELRLFGEARHEKAEGPRNTHVTAYDRVGTVTGTADTLGESMPPAARQVLAVGTHAGHDWRGTRLEAGLRYDWLDSDADPTLDGFTPAMNREEGHLSAEAGVSHARGGVTGYVHAASGFRAPNLEELYYRSPIHGGLFLFGNSDLRTETSESYEIGVRTGELFGGVVRQARVSGYRSNVEDLISFEWVALVNGVNRFQHFNVDRARIEGMEYALDLKAGIARISVNAAFPRGFDRNTGERLPDVGTGRILLDASVPVSRVLPNAALAARLRWNDAVWSADTVWYRPSFTTVSLEASTVFAGFRAAFAVHNLFDTSYREPMSFIDEPGRTLALSLRYDITTTLGHDRRIR